MSATEPVAGLPLRSYLLGFAVTTATAGLLCLVIAVVGDDASAGAVTISLVGGLVIGTALWAASRNRVSHRRRAGLARVGPPAPGSQGPALRRGAVVGGALGLAIVAVTLVLVALPGGGGGTATSTMVLVGLAVWQVALAAEEGRQGARDGCELHTYGTHPTWWRTRLLPDRLVLVERG